MRALLYRLMRHVLFRLEPERAHRCALPALAWLKRLHLNTLVAAPMIHLPRRVMGLEFPNPVGLAAGLDKDGDYIDGLAALGFGFIEVGTVTPQAQPGNPSPRLFRLPQAQALINRLGFNNAGVDYMVDRLKQTSYRGIIGVNIGKNKDTPAERAVDDYRHCLQKVYPWASYVAVNISSPNTAGLRDLQQETALEQLMLELQRVRAALEHKHGRYVPLAVKIAPDLDPFALQALAAALNRVGPDGVIATNTTIQRPGVAALPYADEPGGLSGAPLLPLANQTLTQLRALLNPAIPIIGLGGIVDPASAQTKFDAGADLVQLYTGFIYQGPALIATIVRALAESGTEA